MEKNFVQFINELIELSKEDQHRLKKKDFFKSIGTKYNSHRPDKVEINEDLGEIKLTFVNGFDKEHQGFHKFKFDDLVLEDFKYQSKVGFYDFFQGKSKRIIEVFLNEYLDKLNQSQKRVNTNSYYKNFPNLIKAIGKLLERLSLLTDKENDNTGRPQEYDMNNTKRWWDELSQLPGYHRKNGKIHINRISQEIISRHKKVTGTPPSLDTIKYHRRKLGL